jgi:hypothetical protein
MFKRKRNIQLHMNIYTIKTQEKSANDGFMENFFYIYLQCVYWTCCRMMLDSNDTNSGIYNSLLKTRKDIKEIDFDTNSGIQKCIYNKLWEQHNLCCN